MGPLWYRPFRFEWPQLLNHQPPSKNKKINISLSDICLNKDIDVMVQQYNWMWILWNQVTWQLQGTVSIFLEVMVPVCCGEWEAFRAGRQAVLQEARCGRLQVQGVVAFLSIQLEGVAQGHSLTPPVREVNLQDVWSLFREWVHPLQPEPKFT